MLIQVTRRRVEFFKSCFQWRLGLIQMVVQVTFVVTVLLLINAPISITIFLKKSKYAIIEASFWLEYVILVDGDLRVGWFHLMRIHRSLRAAVRGAVYLRPSWPAPHLRNWQFDSARLWRVSYQKDISRSAPTLYLGAKGVLEETTVTAVFVVLAFLSVVITLPCWRKYTHQPKPSKNS